MPLVIPTQHVQCAIEIFLSGDNDPMYTTIAVRNSGVAWADGTDIDTAANAVLGAFNTHIGTAKMGNIYSTTGVQWRGRIDLVEFSGFHAIAADAGGQAGPWPPQNVALLVRKNTGGVVGQRSGRMYVPGCIRESDVGDTGVIVGASLTALQTAFDNWFAALVALDLEPAVLRSITPSNPGGTPSDISSFAVDQVVATQRRRLRR